LGLSNYCQQFVTHSADASPLSDKQSAGRKRAFSESSDVFDFLEKFIREPGLQLKLQKLRDDPD